jgi:hypothetical protein
MNEETPKPSADREERRRAMMAIVGLWADRDDICDSVEYVRGLRKSNRLERLEKLRAEKGGGIIGL